MRFRSVASGRALTFIVHWVCAPCNTERQQEDSLAPLDPSDELCPLCGTRWSLSNSLRQSPRQYGDCRHDLGEVIQAVQQATAAMPETPGGDPLSIATALFGQGQIKLALVVLDRSLAKNDGGPSYLRWEMWIVKAQLAENLGNHAAAALVWQAALGSGAPPVFYQRLANALARDDRPLEALTAAQRCLEIETRDVVAATAHDTLARIHQTLGQIQAAEKHYRHAVALAPANSPHWRALVRFFAATGRHASARAHLDDALSTLDLTDATKGELYKLLAWTLAESKDDSSGLAAAKLALAFAPNDIEALFLFARTLALAGQRERALDQLRHVLKMDPEHADAKRALEVLTAPHIPVLNRSTASRPSPATTHPPHRRRP